MGWRMYEWLGVQISDLVHRRAVSVTQENTIFRKTQFHYLAPQSINTCKIDYLYSVTSLVDIQGQI